MEKLLENDIDTRYSGKTTAIDVFAKVNDKIILIQVKSTIRDRRVISREHIKDLLEDSVFFEKYPVFDMAFLKNGEIIHIFVPIEEIISHISKRSISLSISRLQNLLSYNFLEFVKRFKGCTFPILKYDENQFKSWLSKLD